MQDKIFTLEFNGYWLECNISNMPSESGIFCVYACVYYSDRDTVGLNKLLYIGQSDKVRNQIESHELRQTWMNYTVNNQLGQTLCYNYAKTDNSTTEFERKFVNSLLISEHKPPLNEKAEDNFFNKEVVKISTSGKNTFLKNSIVLNKV